MELLSPSGLWKDFDRSSIPLDPSVISVRTESGVTTERLYFTGMTAADGAARVYARLVYPASGFDYVAVTAGDIGQPVDSLKTIGIERRRVAVLFVDYAGRNDGERYTLYPDSLAFAEPAVTADTLSALPDNPRETCWYVWAVVYLRAVAYAEQRFPEAKLLCVGIGCGGAQAVKAAALVPAAGAVLIGADRADSEDLAFKASLSGESYVPRIHAPLLLLCGSNETGAAAERASENYNAARDARLYIRPRSFGNISTAETDALERFLDEAVVGGRPLPENPAIEARASESHLYCDIAAPGADKVTLYSAQSALQAFLRNWHKTATETAGDSRLARVSVYNAEEPVYLIAVARYGALHLSSPMLTVRPAALGIAPDTVQRSRLVYDSEMGPDDWVTGSAGLPARMGYGALGIAGVTGAGDVTTYKLGDYAFGAGAGDVLQILLYSETRQNVTFRAVDRDGVTYVCEKQVNPFSGWMKFTFSAGEFKNRDGALSGWTEAAGFGVSSEQPVVVNSLLWV